MIFAAQLPPVRPSSSCICTASRSISISSLNLKLTVFSPKLSTVHYIFKSQLSFELSSGRVRATNDNICDEENEEPTPPGFSALAEETPWDSEDVWDIYIFYLLILHVPLSFGGLSVVAKLLNPHLLDPQTEALSIIVFQMLELLGTQLLLKYTAKREYKFTALFKGENLSGKRNWQLAAALGFGVLFMLVFLTSLFLDNLFEPQAVNNLLLRDILHSSDISIAACVVVYCLITPFLEETVYRFFLLSSLSSTMKWQQAVVISSLIFSAAHFSVENILQLFTVGCVLGCTYCWTGNLKSSVTVHSLYNTMALIITYLN